MTRLAASLLATTGHYLGLVRPHPRQLVDLAGPDILPRTKGAPSVFRRPIV